MENIFKAKILEMSEGSIDLTFGEALVGRQNWFLKAIPEIKNTVSQINEKSVVIESFSRFAKEKIHESPTQSLSFERGEIVEKKLPLDSWEKLHDSKKAFKDHFISLLPADLQEHLETKFTSSIKAIVLTESRLASNEIVPGNMTKDYQPYFKADVGELLKKMLEALKLQHHEYMVISCSEFNESDLFELLYWLSPNIVIPLGATSTKKVLKSNEKLSLIHGKTVDLSLMEKVIKVVPLFHPSVLVGNANMKKTTWQDMQEIIKILHSEQ